MGSIIYQSGYIFFGHFRELFLEYTFQTCQNDKAIPTIIVVDHPELDITGPFFYDRRLEEITRQFPDHLVRTNSHHLLRIRYHRELPLFKFRRSLVRAFDTFNRSGTRCILVVLRFALIICHL